MGYTTYETTHIAMFEEFSHALRDVIEEAHGVPQEVHRPKYLSRLTDELLHKDNTAL